MGHIAYDAHKRSALDIASLRFQVLRSADQFRIALLSMRGVESLPNGLIAPGADAPHERKVTMKTLTQKHIDTVRSALKGARLAKFDGSIAILKESAAQECWTPRGSIKAGSGFYQGLVSRLRYNYSTYNNPAAKNAWELAHMIRYGRYQTVDVAAGLKFIKESLELEGERLKVSDEAVFAWVALCQEVDELRVELFEARPKPVVTAIGLSPKVTKTLKEMNLDIDLPTIKPAKMEARYRDLIHPKTGKVVIDKETGEPEQERYYVPVWSEGIVHGTSRFYTGCEACGKFIPSGYFVPVEAHDKKKDRLVSLWLGCDCARNIFGVKDIGIERT